MREHDVEVALPRSSADLWPHPSTHGRSRRACACLPGCMIVRDARRWEATWTCSELIKGHASWLWYRSPMASMMAAVSTVRTMMTTWRAGATHPYASAGRRGDSGAGRGHGRSHKTPYGLAAALNQVWYSPAISRLIFARMHPLQTRLCASSSELSSPRCPCSPVSHNNHSL